MYSNTVVSILEASGWTADRRVPTAQWVSELEAEGFTMTRAAVRILEEFGGLKILPREDASDTFLKGFLHFDPAMAIDSALYARVSTGSIASTRNCLHSRRDQEERPCFLQRTGEYLPVTTTVFFLMGCHSRTLWKIR